MQRAKDLATPHTQCLLYATYWFRPVLSELLGAATELFDQNRERAPSGPVKVAVSAHERQTAGVRIASRVSTLMAWFPARWASKIAPLFTSGHKAAGLPQDVAEATIHSIQSAQRLLENLALGEGTQDKVEGSLKAVRFADNNVTDVDLGIFFLGVRPI